MVVRTYCRQSKNDEGKQQFSLDVQSIGCAELVQRMGFGDATKVEYVDDGRAGDDFLTRSGLRQLLADARRGDIIICRDQSRLGRDAIEVTLVVRDLVRDRGCRLYYYVTGQEVLFAKAIDQATTFIQGTGHQMELEAIRSRTREALRSRVRDGRIAVALATGTGSNARRMALVGGTRSPSLTRSRPPSFGASFSCTLMGGTQGDRAPAQQRGHPCAAGRTSRQRLMGTERGPHHPPECAIPRRLHPRAHQEGEARRRIGPREGRAARDDRHRDPRVADRGRRSLARGTRAVRVARSAGSDRASSGAIRSHRHRAMRTLRRRHHVGPHAHLWWRASARGSTRACAIISAAARSAR
jgi:DNA invertase Pin-like site-specific DNA recombinase